MAGRIDMVGLTNEETTKALREPVASEFIGGEFAFEEHIVEHLEEICEFLGLDEIRNVQRQKQIRADRFQVIMDIIVKHTDESVTIFEVKKFNNKYPANGPVNQMQGVGQVLLYQNIYELRFGVRPRLVLIDNKIYERTMMAFMNNALPITLMEMQKDRMFIPYRGW